MSEFTAQALHNDVMQTRRKIEIPHYEFFFTASAPLAGTVQLENWTDLDNTVSYDQQSIRVSNVLDFSNAAKVQFGSGVQSPVDNTITGVQTLIQQYDLATTFEVSTQSANALVFKHKVFPTLTFFDFREIAILDSSNNCIFYSVAPWVRYPPNTKCHVKVALTLT
jgi:hypothetical protein